MWLNIQPGDLLIGRDVKMHFFVIQQQKGFLAKADEIFRKGPYIELEFVRLTNKGPSHGKWRIYQEDLLHVKNTYQLFRDGQEIEMCT